MAGSCTLPLSALDRDLEDPFPSFDVRSAIVERLWSMPKEHYHLEERELIAAGPQSEDRPDPYLI